MELEKFEEEIKEIFDEDFVKRAKNLKKTGNIFNPLFYLTFTRLVELSALINDVVLPNENEIGEMFRTRKEFLQIDYKTISEILKRVWVFEIRRGEEYKFSQSVEDLMYIVHRMGKIQSKIDEVIKKNITKWEKEEILELYFVLLKTLLELDEQINREIEMID
ncbi:hypothetical protein DRP05_05870 [Archaeoglobales archaeon]|nr:MAG: hypothetical protein DRP05_05870 [Archaeoglobales archaeon]